MKSLIINPYKRKKARTQRRNSRPVIVVHRNAPKKRAAAKRKGKGHSPAMRRKIGLAVKRAMAAKRSGGSKAVARRSPSRSVARRSPSRPVARRNTSKPSFKPGIGGLVSKDLLVTAGSAVAGTMASQMVLSRFGQYLPGVNQPIIRIAYRVGIPAAGAFLIGKKNRNVSNGLMIAAAITLVNDIIKYASAGVGRSAPVAPTAAYISSNGNPRDLTASLSSPFKRDAWTS